jgi:hydroxymethylglutaryl-CoA reductase (NADPH)
MASTSQDKRIPRDSDNDYTRGAAEARRKFWQEQTGVELEHLSSYSFDPSILSGNIESFVGVAQVPIGVAGPLLVDGEHAKGEFFVPLATAEGTLVASYNRGIHARGRRSFPDRQRTAVSRARAAWRCLGRRRCIG